VQQVSGDNLASFRPVGVVGCPTGSYVHPKAADRSVPRVTRGLLSDERQLDRDACLQVGRRVRQRKLTNLFSGTGTDFSAETPGQHMSTTHETTRALQIMSLIPAFCGSGQQFPQPQQETDQVLSAMIVRQEFPSSPDPPDQPARPNTQLRHCVVSWPSVVTGSTADLMQ
jgi:hypothetical protein